MVLSAYVEGRESQDGSSGKVALTSVCLCYSTGALGAGLVISMLFNMDLVVKWRHAQSQFQVDLPRKGGSSFESRVSHWVFYFAFISSCELGEGRVLACFFSRPVRGWVLSLLRYE